MNKYLQTALLIVWGTFFTQAQFDLHQIKQQIQARNVRENPVKLIIRQADDYWQYHDRFQPHNGVKPYERWKYIWENYTGPDADFSGALLRLYRNRRNTSARPHVDDSNWQLVGDTEYTVTGGTEGKGRVNVIEVDPNNPNTIYLGTPAGGLWKSTDGGIHWTPLTDELPAPGVSAIAVDPTNSNVIYIGTGDDDGLVTPSVGLFKSSDGGQTWNLIAPANFDFISGVVVNPNNPNIITFASSDGIFHTTDGGQTWSLAQAGYFRELRIHPTNPQYVYAVTSDSFFRSTDGGASFQKITSGLPASSNVSRMVMDVTPAAPDKVYVLAINGNSFVGMYISSDKGTAFSRTAENTNIVESQQGYYDLALAVSDTDPNMIFYGELNIWRSTDGGNQFIQINQWHTMNASYTHADIHFMKYFNGNLYVGSDGGIYKSADNGNHFVNLNDDLAISQHYKISVSQNLTDQYIYGGLQDNGGIAFNNPTWNIYHGADGMDNAVDYFNKQLAYSFIYYGASLNITTDGGQSVALAVSGPEYGRWVTPLEMSPANELYAGFRRVYKLVNNQWQAVTQNNLSGRIRVMKFHPLHPQELYVAITGELLKSTNGGQTFQSVYNFPSNITAIEVNPDGPEMWVTTANNVWFSSDAGTTWTDITAGLPAGIALHDIVYHRFSPDTRLYVATDAGVYRKTGNNPWEIFSNHLPKTIVTDLELNNKAGYLWAGTHGRSVWKTAVPSYDAQKDLAVYGDPTIQHLSCSPVSQVSFNVKNEGQTLVTAFDYTAVINGQTLNQTWTGNLAQGQTVTLNFPVNPPLELGVLDAQLEVSLTGDQIAVNNKAIIHALVNKAEPGIFTYNLESPAQELLTEDIMNVWERAIPSGSVLNHAQSGQYAYCTNASGNYPDGATAYLYMPCLDLTQVQNPEIKFEMAYDIEFEWDYINVEYSTDNGQTWQILGTASDPDWYNNNSTQGLCPGAQWTGTNTTFATYSHELASLNHFHPLIRFVFQSDTYINQEGVVLDNPRIEGQLAVENLPYHGLKLYPVPAGDFITVENNNPKLQKITVTDLNGKTLTEKTINQTGTYRINVKNWPAGTYILHWQFPAGVFTTKILVK